MKRQEPMGLRLAKIALVTFVALVLMDLNAYGAKAPKYGPDASPLSAKTNSEYFKLNDASDYWSMAPFYVAQLNDSSCSAATLSMVLNAARGSVSLTQEDELVTEKNLVENYTDDRYRYQVSGDPALAVRHGFVKLGVSVERLSEILKTATNRLKIKSPNLKIQLQTIDQKNLEKSKKIFHDLLVKNEKSNHDFIIINFTQGILTGDAGGMVGHIAPIGAYDEKKRLVLIMDPDRQWYEPYWSPEDKVFEAISDSRSDSHPGYLYFSTK